ncbi:ABC transporter ATP-binding protein [Cohnella sp. CIP 111063]|uniref:ABC-F family ATP-binding cassette domain-containing protein n=1 Tax=unclassified Cohnella TaxID=2636738 RepID=UPI000B8C31AF|nr:MULTISPECIES: ABC-F family ATP-binding cassette domain-containing protein [unclassified Cohnella]OXS57666.1 ABC transporter ATP-binding protein [Cohnella sp. CIP 111063]PRX71055.1 ATPase subunit of ABC transporter with duplicated ATPase domains [Cohnella sp. SGD-V74]
MLTINCQNVRKYNAAQLVLDNVTFELHHGEKAGLVGRNGSGKTTLMRLIAKLDTPDEGLLTVRKDARIGYLEQIPADSERRTVYDALALGYRGLLECRAEMTVLEQRMAEPQTGEGPELLETLLQQYAALQERFEREGGYELDAHIDQVAGGLRIGKEWYERDYASLSGGEKTKVGLASQLIRKPDLLLLDEPTNHLDMGGVEWLEEFLLKYDGACLIVSHDRYFLDRVVTKIVELEDGESLVFHANYTKYMKEKEELVLQQFADYQEQQKKIKKMRETIKQLMEWGRIGDNGKFFRRAASMQKALDRMEKVKRPAIDRKEAEFELRPTDRSGKQVVALDGVVKRYGQADILRGASAQLEYGEKAMLIGPNGAGKSTLLRLILGQEEADGGELRLGSRVEVGYLAQQQLPEQPKQSVLDYFRREAGMEEGEARSRLAACLFYGADVFKPVGLLSGGEWTRLRLALLVLRKPNLLVLDEPTNHMDIASREALEEALEEYPGTILAVTHDRYLINRLSQKIWELNEGRLTVYLGDFDDYKAESRRRRAAGKPAEPASDRQSRTAAERPKSVIPVAARQTVPVRERLEAEIAELERRLAELDDRMNGSASAGLELEREWAEREGVRESLDRLYEQWMESSGE